LRSKYGPPTLQDFAAGWSPDMTLLRRLRRIAGRIRDLGRRAIGLQPKGHFSSVHLAHTLQQPLLRAEKTYNTHHPDYDPEFVRNYPGRIMGAGRPCNNVVYAEITRFAFAGRVPHLAWALLLKRTMAEAATVPGFQQIMQRKDFTEHYLTELGRTHGAQYFPGWVNLQDAQFLYWVVRRLRPKVIVQTGVSNGLSSAFMMLALAKNGDNGVLHAIDQAHVFDPNNPDWTRPGEVYGVAIPHGQTSGWMVPDRYRDRCFVEQGDATVLLPKLVDRLASIDMFFHDSDHTYSHMMFEFEQATRKLSRGGAVVADDVSWNASLWDFAEARGVPAYNYRGTIGVAFC
jgi:predicted O-methyltransferase YrrM